MFYKKKSNQSVKTTKKEELKTFFNERVYFGPFSGLKIPENLYSVLSLSEILGLYESCLHPIFEDVLNKNIKNAIIVGGNNGYYTAGLSYLFNPENFYVFEMDERMHFLIESWYKKNDLKKPHILGEANDENFIEFQDGIDLLLIDCEGAEITLLNPDKFKWQKNTNIILELHPFYVNNLINLISKRFSKTHEIKLIYDDFQEDEKIQKILNGLNLNIEYSKHPTHRWIIENNNKIYTSGIFMYLKCK